jgi:APA family basic amino acid/polyamine antiporter
VGVWILRSKRPDLDRPFKVPFMPVVPILGVLACVGLMATLPADTWLRLAIWMGLGLVIYFAYGKSHSALNKR